MRIPSFSLKHYDPGYGLRSCVFMSREVLFPLNSQACNSKTWEAEAGGLEVPNSFSLRSQFEDSWGYMRVTGEGERGGMGGGGRRDLRTAGPE